MIPKIIHYCWLSDDPIPDNLSRCIDTWHKFMPDYRFIKWDFSIFPKGKSGQKHEIYIKLTTQILKGVSLFGHYVDYW